MAINWLRRWESYVPIYWSEEVSFMYGQQFHSPSPKRSPGPPPGHKGCVGSGQRKYEVQHLWERHHEMKRLAILGFTHRQIATQLGISPQTVINVMNSAIMKKELQLARAAADGEAVDARKELNRLLPKALSVLEEILEDDEKPIALRAKVAMDNLSRCGFAPQINVKGTFEHTHFSAEDLEAIKRDAAMYRALALANSNCVDAEFISVAQEAEEDNEDNGRDLMCDSL